MKIKNYYIILLLGILGFTSCNSDEVAKQNLYTFTGVMLGQYLQDSSQVYSEFVRLLDTTNVMGLLNSYGTYTCFAPTNDAMHAFYKLNHKNSLSDFTLDSLKTIAYDHIINGTAATYQTFVNGRLPNPSMSDRYISILMTDTATWVNYSSKILEKDIIVHNGVIQKIDKVLNPSREGIVDAISHEGKFRVFYTALIATGMADSLLKTVDKTYDPEKYADLVTVTEDMKQWYYQQVPQKRKFGYTVLMESDSTYEANGIDTTGTNAQILQSLEAWASAHVYNEDPSDANVKDITDRRNSLNKFISYHLIDKELSHFTFIDAYDTDHMIKTDDMYEYIETMCPNTLIEVKIDRYMANGNNLFDYQRETGHFLRLSPTFYDKDATNGIYHEIEGMLVYDQAEENELSTKRLRFDAASFFPELTNNGMRGESYAKNTTPSLYTTLPSINNIIPKGYISRLTESDQTMFNYLPGDPRFQDYEGDEVYLNASSGNLYDFSVITPPVPAGTYEVRFGYETNGKRGVAQLYLDNTPCGVPLNLNNTADQDGWVLPGSDPADPDGYLNDKIMRNNGYMKGPADYKVVVPSWSSGQNARYSNVILRRILGTYTFDKAGNHLFTVKGLSGGEFMFDYMEFVPTSALETEDIY